MRSRSRAAAARPAARLPLGARLALSVALPMLVAGCGGDTPPAAVFKPPNYSYLTPLRLNVGQIQVQDNVTPAQDPADLTAQSPVPPDQALKQMAQDRLVAAGNSGTAVFTIDQASITGQPGGTLDGTLAVHLDIVTNSGGHAGYAEAHVSRQFVPGSDTSNEGVKSQLYDLTTHMMQDMNVEFEFQLRRTLGDWMLDASGAPVAAAVQQQSLDTPGAPAGAPTQAPPPPASAAPAPESEGAPLQLAPAAAAAAPGKVMPSGMPVQTAPSMSPGSAPADTTVPDGSGAPVGAPMPLSPPPGMLQAPPGAVPVPAQAPAPAPAQASPAADMPAPATSAGPVQLAPPAVYAPPGPVAPPGPAAYHGVYPTPPGYHPAATAPDGSATPSGY